MSIVRLYSADMYVHDLDRAVDFYVGKLGFEKRADEPVDEEGHRWGRGRAQTLRRAAVDGLAGTIGAWEPVVPGVDCYEQHRFGGGESWKR